VPPAPQAGPAAVAPATPEEAAWKVALDLKNGGKGLQAEELFARFREQFPASKRCNEALVEMGVCWMMVARDLQNWHRNRPESIDRFRRAEECFERVTREHADDPVAARASYCQGLVWIQLGDLDKAWSAFTTTIEKYPGDKLYRTKSIERRSAVSRHRLETAKAQPDIDLFLREVDPKLPEYKEAYALVQRFASYARAMDKPAPALRPELWASSSSTSLESLKGEVVALYFFASWCHNCLKEAEFIHEMTSAGARWACTSWASPTSAPRRRRRPPATHRATRRRRTRRWARCRPTWRSTTSSSP
jgi:tetratricopeptide (TPR) repeat protein